MLTAWLNARYAERHGYAFRYLQLLEPGCAHPRWGWRHPSYCKLPALAFLLRQFEMVAFIDSDSFFAPVAPALSSIFPAKRSGDAEVLFASDRPFTPGPNCGFMIWPSSESTLALLSNWWNLDMGPFGMRHDFEQRALHWVLAHVQAFRSGRMRTLTLRPFDLNARAAVVSHVDHTRRGERLWRAGVAILGVHNEAKQIHERRTQLLERVSDLFVKNTTSDGDVNIEDLRLLLLHAATAVARTWPSRSRQGRRRSSTLGLGVSAERFNASHVAEALLVPPREEDLHLEGLPLVLRTCSQLLQKWQAWSIADASRNDDDVDPPVRLLTGKAGFCISPGPAALRSDGAPLAQLVTCTTFAHRLAMASQGDWWMFDAPSNEAALNGTRSQLRDEAEYTPGARDLATSAEADRLSTRKAARLFARLARAHAGNRLPPLRYVRSTQPRLSTSEPIVASTTQGNPGAAGGKHGEWRKLNADPSRLFSQCPWHRNADKSTQDCESWCRPLRSPAHCRTCKCSACSTCHGSRNLSVPSGPPARLDARRHPVTRRLRKGGRLCLAAYRKDLLDGNALTFASCRPHMLKSQQHWTLKIITLHGGRSGFQLRPRANDGLCVTAYPMHLRAHT